jgi:hypothetical protein
MRQKADILQNYIGTTQKKGKNPKSGKICSGGSEIRDGTVFCMFVQKR